MNPRSPATPQRAPTPGRTLLCTIASALAVVLTAPTDATAQLAYEAPPLPAGIDTLVTLGELSDRVDDCGAACPGVVYVWSPRMPLSREGIPEIESAARRLGVPLTILGTEEVHDYAESGAHAIPLGDEMLAAGVLAHAPAVVVHDGEDATGPAILGYKRADTYLRMLGRRLSGAGRLGEAASNVGQPLVEGEHPGGSPLLERGRPLVDYEAVGSPGAYFRWVPGRDALAYESGERIYLLDLTDGRSRLAPGYVDFVPTPDGRYFVTPGPGRDGLAFYDAGAVFEAARDGTPESVGPFFTDPRMRDQYPSVGILEEDGPRVVYRVLTSWFEGIVYRDYEVTAVAGAPRVRPLGDPVTPCEGSSLSIPIMSQDGREVAARDESTGTTRIYRILRAGRCREVHDLGVQTRKVAWHSTGERLAFATPRTTRRRAGRDPYQAGIYLLERDSGRITRVPGSDGANPLVFPEFVGDDSVVFVVPGRSRGEPGVFRVVEGIR